MGRGQTGQRLPRLLSASLQSAAIGREQLDRAATLVARARKLSRTRRGALHTARAAVREGAGCARQPGSPGRSNQACREHGPLEEHLGDKVSAGGRAALAEVDVLRAATTDRRAALFARSTPVGYLRLTCDAESIGRTNREQGAR